MLIIQLIILLISALFISFSALIYNKFKKLFETPAEYHLESEFTIIVAAKNEAENIHKLIISLMEIDYSQHKMEVMLIDDNSEDDTLKIIEKEINSLENFKVYSLRGKKYSGKKGALSYGIENSKFPLIFITDADCIIEPNILKSLSFKFGNGYDMLFGPSPFLEGKTFINRMICFENLRNSILMFSSAGYGIPYSSTARNFAFKKSVFEKSNGFSRHSKILSGDDDLLLQSAVKNKFRIGVITDRQSFVYSETKKTFKEYLHQRARHTQTSFYYLPSRIFLLTLWHFLNLILLFSPFLIFLNQWFFILFIVKLLTDLIITTRLQKKFTYNFKLYEIILFQIIYELMLIVNLVNAKFGRIKWK